MNGEPPTAGRTIGSGVRLLADPERGSAPPQIIWLILGQHIPCLAGPARRCPGRRQRQQPLRPVHLRTASNSARRGSDLNNFGLRSFRRGSLTGSGSARPHLAGECEVRRLRSSHGEVDAMDDVAGAPR